MSNERKFNIEDLDEYIRHGEPDKKEKAYIRQTTTSLLLVDWIQVLAHMYGLRRNGRGNLDWMNLQVQDKLGTSPEI